MLKTCVLIDVCLHGGQVNWNDRTGEVCHMDYITDTYEGNRLLRGLVDKYAYVIGRGPNKLTHMLHGKNMCYTVCHAESFNPRLEKKREQCK